MRTFLIRGVIAGMVVVTLAGGGTANAAAPTPARTTSSFGLTASGGEAALGTVSSRNARCVKNRTVKLFLIRPGKARKLVGVDRRTGRPTGNGDGYWVIPANLKPGRTYVAVVTKRTLKRVICTAYRTSRLRYHG